MLLSKLGGKKRPRTFQAVQILERLNDH